MPTASSRSTTSGRPTRRASSTSLSTTIATENSAPRWTAWVASTSCRNRAWHARQWECSCFWLEGDSHAQEFAGDRGKLVRLIAGDKRKCSAVEVVADGVGDGKKVLAGLAEQRVAASAANELVGAVGGGDGVVAVATGNDVG